MPPSEPPLLSRHANREGGGVLAVRATVLEPCTEDGHGRVCSCTALCTLPGTRQPQPWQGSWAVTFPGPRRMAALDGPGLLMGRENWCRPGGRGGTYTPPTQGFSPRLQKRDCLPPARDRGSTVQSCPAEEPECVEVSWRTSWFLSSVHLLLIWHFPPCPSETGY